MITTVLRCYLWIPKIFRASSGVAISRPSSFAIAATDELHADAFITDATYNELAKRYDEKQLIDFVMTAGQYVTVSMFLNTFGVPRSQGVPGLPEPAKK